MRLRGFNRMVKSILGVSVLVASFALHAQGAAVELVVNVFSQSGDPLNAISPGDQIIYEIGVIVDPAYSGPLRGTGNRGLATLVYNVNSAEADTKGYFLDPMQDAFSGFNTAGEVGFVSSRFYNDSTSTSQVNYGGGWGFDRAGLPGGGDVTTSPGQIIAAGATAPLTWVADVNSFVGLQPKARLDVGVGTYMFPADDPLLGGRTGGFGQDFSNLNAEIGSPGNMDGDGTWFVQFGVIDTATWAKQTYNFDLLLFEGGANVFDGVVDYSVDQGTGFRLQVAPPSELLGTNFAFTLIPEPGTMALLAFGGLAVIRRRRG